MAASEIPSSMRAWHYSARGAPSDVLQLSASHPMPPSSHPLRADHVLVKVSHAALNPVGYTLMWLVPALFRRSPSVPEIDFCGDVVGLGSDVRSPHLSRGVTVFGIIPAPAQQKTGFGTLCEYVAVPASMVAVKPARVTDAEAAGLGCTGLTALCCVTASKLQPGDRVLINGASGGVGTMLVQVARATVGSAGTVVATCSDANLAMVRRLGADAVVDYRAHAPVADHLGRAYADQAFDAVIDTVGAQDLYARSAAYLKDGKPFVNVGAMAAGEGLSVGHMVKATANMAQNVLRPRFLGGTPRPYIFVSLTPTPELMAQLARLVESGQLKTVVDSIWPMEDALKAYERILSHRAKGKVIVSIQ